MANHWFICQRCNLQSPEASYNKLPDGWVHLGVSEDIPPDYIRGCFLCPGCAEPIVEMCKNAPPEAKAPDTVL